MLLVVAGARLEDDRARAFQSLDLNLTAEDSTGDRNLLPGEQIITDSPVSLVLLQDNLENQVARVVVESLVTAAFDAKEHLVIDGGRNLDAEFNRLGDKSSAVAGPTFDKAVAAANRAEARFRRLNGVETLLAASAYVFVSDLPDLRALARFAELDTVIGDLSEVAIIGLLKGDADFEANVAKAGVRGVLRRRVNSGRMAGHPFL